MLANHAPFLTTIKPGTLTYKKVMVGTKAVNKKVGKKFVINAKTGKLTVKKGIDCQACLSCSVACSKAWFKTEDPDLSFIRIRMNSWVTQWMIGRLTQKSVKMKRRLNMYVMSMRH